MTPTRWSIIILASCFIIESCASYAGNPTKGNSSKKFTATKNARHQRQEMAKAQQKRKDFVARKRVKD